MTRLEPEFEETLRRYVLGTLEGPARLRLEEQLVGDPDSHEALGVIEDELTEEYLDGTLSQAERADFERHHLALPGRSRVPGFFTELRARAAQSTASRPGAVRPWPQLAWLSPRWLGAAAALLVLSLAGNAWLALEMGSRSQTGGPDYTLTGSLLRAEGVLPRIVVPPHASVVRLHVELPADDYPTYRAVLEDANGDEVWSQSRLTAEETPEAFRLSLLLPAAALSHEDYLVKVSGVTEEGESRGLASYPFRAERARDD